MKEIFIQIIGGHAVGKSATASWLKNEYKENVCLLGKYKISKTTPNVSTGGLDAEKLTNQQRFELIEKSWFNDSKIVIAEGMIISYWGSFLSKYKKLQEKKERRVLIIHLFSDIEKVKERVYKRSNGKELNTKRLENLIGKLSSAKSSFRKCKLFSSYELMEFDTTEEKSFDIVKEELKKKIEGG